MAAGVGKALAGAALPLMDMKREELRPGLGQAVQVSYHQGPPVLPVETHGSSDVRMSCIAVDMGNGVGSHLVCHRNHL